MSAMGDVAMTVPVVAAVRRAYPEMRITVVTRPFFRPFFADVAGVEFADVDLKGRHKGVDGIRLLADELVRAGVDAVADLHGVLRSHLLRSFMALKGCKTARIRKGRIEKRQLTRKGAARSEQLRTSIERYTEVMHRLGLVPDSVERWQPSERNIPEAIRMHVPKKGVWIGVSPFAMHRGKAYPLEQMERAVELIAPQVERVFVFGGGEQERKESQRLESVAGNVHSVVGVMSLAEELDLMANLDVMVAMDSSAMHMSSLVGTPVVSIWGATHPYAGFYGFGQSADGALQVDMTCRPCSVFGNKPCKWGDYRCLTSISPEMVARKTLDTARCHAKE